MAVTKCAITMDLAIQAVVVIPVIPWIMMAQTAQRSIIVTKTMISAIRRVYMMALGYTTVLAK